MKKQALVWARGTALMASTLAIGGSIQAFAHDGDSPPSPPMPTHFQGLLNDYTPSAAVVKNGPYEMRGSWTLDVDWRHKTAVFTAAMNMETSDFGIEQGNVNKDDPTTRGAHTHHISVTDLAVADDDSWMTACPGFSPAVTDGFVVSSMNATITGNGTTPPFGNPSPITICILGADKVAFSNITMTLGAPASGHFGKQAIHGVVLKCAVWERASGKCAVQE